MIFGRRRNQPSPSSSAEVSAEADSAVATETAPDTAGDEPALSGDRSEPADGASEGDDVPDAEPGAGGTTAAELTAAELAELDELDWRELGPYDIAEVDADALEEPDPDQPRIDLGSMVLSAVQGTELRLQVDENSQQIVSAMLIWGDSALEVGAFAAPRSGGLWAEIRDELAEGAQSAGGSANLVPGPFGVELRRLLPVETPDGQQGYQPSRMWVAEGPRWMLRGIVYGQAALEDGLESPVAEILEAFRQIVVRRGEEAMAPGDLLPLSLPEDMARSGSETDETPNDTGGGSGVNTGDE